MEIVFSNPENLWLLFSIPILVITHFFVFSFLKRRALRFANFEVIKRINGPQGSSANTHFVSSNIFLLILRVASIALLVISSAGATLWYSGKASGSSFVIAIDASSSMLASDIKPNRIEAAKNTASDFVKGLPNSRVGIVDFAGATFVKQTITEDLLSARGAIEQIEVENVGGTSIGDAIITSSNMLAEETNAKAIILITDGQSNVGALPEEGVDQANNNNIVIYTIGIGSEEGGAFIKTDLLSKLDEPTLINISNRTGGKYFPANDVNALKAAYFEISAITMKKVSLQLSGIFLTLGILLIFFEWTLLNTKYRTLP